MLMVRCSWCDDDDVSNFFNFNETHVLRLFWKTAYGNGRFSKICLIVLKIVLIDYYLSRFQRCHVTFECTLNLIYWVFKYLWFKLSTCSFWMFWWLYLSREIIFDICLVFRQVVRQWTFLRFFYCKTLMRKRGKEGKGGGVLRCWGKVLRMYPTPDWDSWWCTFLWDWAPLVAP